MAINFINAAGAGGPNGAVTVNIAISNNDTVIIVVASDAAIGLLDPSDTGGTVYTNMGLTSFGAVQVGLWASPAGGAHASSSVSCSAISASTDLVAIVARYSGVGRFGPPVINAGTNANPSISLSTSGANSFVVSAFANNSGHADTALTGNLRQSTFFKGAANDTGSLVDTTSASPAVLTTAATQIASTWVALAMEMFAAGMTSDDFWMPPSPSSMDPNISVW